MEDHYTLTEGLPAVPHVLAIILHGLAAIADHALPCFPHRRLAGIATAGEVRHVQRLTGCLYDAFQGVLLHPDLGADGLPTPQVVQIGVTSTLNDVDRLIPMRVDAEAPRAVFNGVPIHQPE